MRIEYHPEALAEFREAAVYYEKQQAGLGERFAKAVEPASRILQNRQPGGASWKPMCAAA